MTQYVVVRTDPYLSAVEVFEPNTAEKAEAFALRCTMCEDDSRVRYHAVPYGGK